MVNPYQAPPPQQAAFGAAAAPGGGHYEFNEAENAVIGKTATRAMLWGGVALAGGALMLLFVIGLSIFLVVQTKSAAPLVMVVAALPPVLIYLAIGWFYLGAGRSLKEVVATAGSDVPHLMNALSRMSTAFKIEVIVVIIAVVLVIILMIIMVVMLGALAAGLR
ncbi:MAG: hypothetical protein JRI23_20370 [Deltaproteobacteria bacterium]|jgi:hypothetical protein|nr:hypothetical protein [Deltaproteobacteria bacterium]MBW2534242.1 hypothetical protein [Deltaproteobacteria bacterium]